MFVNPRHAVKSARAAVLLRRALVGVTRLVLAQDCVLCRAPSGDVPVCAGCAADLPRIPEACPQCALPSPGGRLCGACILHPPAFDATVAAWRYAEHAAALVHAFKYGSRLALAGFLAHVLAARIGPLPAVDAIVPMPLAPERLAGRGFNQSVEVARLLAPRLRVPLAIHAARRVRSTADQTGLDAEARRANVRGAFAVVADVRGRSVALVDDVMTTGATLNELAGALKREGAARVENWVVARTVRDV